MHSEEKEKALKWLKIGCYIGGLAMALMGLAGFVFENLFLVLTLGGMMILGLMFILIGSVAATLFQKEEEVAPEADEDEVI